MRQYDINVKLAEKTQGISSDLDLFKEESGRVMCSIAETMQIMNKIIDYERRAQRRTNILYGASIIITNISLILTILK